MSMEMPNHLHFLRYSAAFTLNTPQMKRHQREGTLQCQQLRARTAVAHLHPGMQKGV